MLILREAFYGVRRYDGMQRKLGIASNILSDRLQTLVETGILERRRYQERPDRFEYHLTHRGLDLYPVLVALMRWGDKHAPGPDGPPVVLEHAACGQETAPLLVCSACGKELVPGEVCSKSGRAHFGASAFPAA
jgi:DNA-binding HxlR family transcriptional regulator